MSLSIYQMWYGLGENRPEINYNDPRTEEDWNGLDSFHTLVSKLPNGPLATASLWSQNGLGSEWDFISYPGLAGALSERLVLKLAEFSEKCFWYIPIHLDNHRYFIPAAREPVDCLDRTRSDLMFHPSKPDTVIGIRKYCFLSEYISDPMAFCIPETRVGAVFVTSGVKQAIEQLGVFGVDFKLLDTIE